MKSILSRSLAILFVILLSFSSPAIFNAKAQTRIPTLKINLISPSNTTYNQNTILLNFSIQKQPQDNLDYTISYTMQGENSQQQGTFFMGTLSSNQMTFHKNFTEIPDGTYKLTASAKYVDRIIWVYADKQTVTFTIDTKTPTPSPIIDPTPTPSPEPEPEFPTTQVLVIIVTILTGLGILAYIKKYKRKS